MKLRMEKAVYGGACLTHVPPDEPGSSNEKAGLSGKTIFVPYTLPGELVEAHITSDRRSFANAEPDAILEPGRERVLPECEYFPACGGCQYQHASAQYQLQMKVDILQDTLVRAQLGTFEQLASLHAEPWAYRNRIRLQVDRRPKSGGGLALCYRERGSHVNLPISHCPIAAPLLEQAIGTILRIGQRSSLGDLCEEIELFTNNEQDAILVSLFTSHSRSSVSARSGRAWEPKLRTFSEMLKSQLSMLKGVGLFASGHGAEQLLGSWGERSLLYTVAGRKYQVSLGSFFQINRFLLPALLKLVTDGRSGRVAWDLYAGVGLFAKALAFEKVTAVEAAPFSFTDLRHNLAETNHRLVQSTTLDFLRTESRREPRPDLILLDPPRVGLGKEVCEQLSRIASPAIVYVSCDPATFARDLQILLQSGYHMQELHLVDLFPQTFHLETVTVLERN
jgi:23S rRNA (uracil1939-C5)-methyltransferase